MSDTSCKNKRSGSKSSSWPYKRGKNESKPRGPCILFTCKQENSSAQDFEKVIREIIEKDQPPPPTSVVEDGSKVGEVEEEGLSLSELIAREVKSEKDQFSKSSKNSSQNTINNNAKNKIMTRFTGLGAKGVVIFQSPPPIPSSNDETKEEEKKAEKEVDKEEREEVDKEEKEDQELDVVDLTFKIFNQMKERELPFSRFIFRVSPIQSITSSTTLSTISTALSSLLVQFIQQNKRDLVGLDNEMKRSREEWQQHLTYFVQYKRRNCDRKMVEFLELDQEESNENEEEVTIPSHSTSIRDAVHHEVGRLARFHLPLPTNDQIQDPTTNEENKEEEENEELRWKVNFTKGTVVFIIELNKGWCGLSILDGKKYFDCANFHCKNCIKDLITNNTTN